MNDVTRILSAIENGDARAADQLLPFVYEELRRLAKAKLAQEKPGQTLQATALVHEAFMRLVNVEDAQQWNGRGHFFAAAAKAMQRILVERARRKNGPKRGGGHVQMSLDAACELTDIVSDEILAVNEALALLEKESKIKAELVQLRYFAGLSHQEAADALQISRATADRHWRYAKAFLYARLSDGQSD